MKRFLCGPSLVLIAAFVAVSVSGCAGTRAAYQSAETLEETALVVSEHYAAVVTEINDLADGGASESFVRRAQEIEARATPAVLALREASTTYSALASAENAEALQQALERAVVLVSQMIDLLNE